MPCRATPSKPCPLPCRQHHPATAQLLDDCGSARLCGQSFGRSTVGVMQGQVNESDGVGGGSRGQLAKNRDFTQNPSVSEIAWFRQLTSDYPVTWLPICAPGG